jgi:anti-sigma-K factor RskA
MHESEQRPLCDLCLSYISGECSEEEAAAFERHLSECSGCRQEVQELRNVWEVLSVDMERMEPPKDLKKQVFNAISEVDRADTTNKRKHSSRPSIRRTIMLGAAVAAFALMAAGTFWNYRMYEARSSAPLPIEQALSVPAAHIERITKLQATSTENEYAYGVACVVNNGQSKQFIVYVFGAKETTQDQAYQVWLLNGGKRVSAGTFRVSQEGVGVLAMPIASKDFSFEQIGITLEPDDQGDRPRGKKIFGSS